MSKHQTAPVGALPEAQFVSGFPAGIVAFTTTRRAGSFGFGSLETVLSVSDRWSALQDGLGTLGVSRLASATQIHGAVVAQQQAGWSGWLRRRGVDGHVTNVPGTALAITVADCTPIFIAHPAGAIGALHAGWRGTAAHILDVGLDLLTAMGYPAQECTVHLGPAICKSCYEVGPEVLSAVHAKVHLTKGQLDVRAVLTKQAHERRIESVTTSTWCTRCDQQYFFSHRAGDDGRQLGVILIPGESS